MESVQASYDFNEQNLLPGLKLFVKHGYPGITFMNGLLAVLVCAIAVQLIWFSPERMSILVPTVFVAIVLLVQRIRAPHLVMKSAKKSPQFDLPVTITFTPDRLLSNCPGSDGEFAYSFFVKHRVLPEGLMIYFDPSRVLWIPSNAFASADERRQAVEWLEQGRSATPELAAFPEEPTAVHVSYVWNFQSCYAAMMAYQRVRMKFRWFIWPLRVIAILLFLSVLTTLIVQPKPAPFSSTHFLSPLLPLLISCMCELVALLSAAFVRMSPAYQQTIEAQFSPLGYRIRRKGVQSEGVYETILESVTFKSGFLLFYQPHLFDWIPRSAISEPDGYERLALWLEQKTKNRLVR